MEKIFVYGTLMQGQRAHDLLKDAHYISRAILRDYRMFSLNSFPGIQLSKDASDSLKEREEKTEKTDLHIENMMTIDTPPCTGDYVIGELYEVDEETVKRLDEYEGEGTLYDRKLVTVDRYTDKYYEDCPFIFQKRHSAYAYVYKGDADNLKTIPYMWNTKSDDYVWYAAYGSNIDEERFLCYLEGGTLKANGRYYSGCDDKTRWIDEDIALYPGTVYSSNHSSSWNGKGVAFYDEKERMNLLKGTAFMKLYKIRRCQLEQIQDQEGNYDSWYGRTAAVGIHVDDVPVYTFTSRRKGSYSEPDIKYANLIKNAIAKECEKRDIRYGYGLDTWLMLMTRNPRYEELEEKERGGRHPYKLFCMKCLNTVDECHCNDADPFRYKCYTEIDNNMVDIVKAFNKKGYRTVACCEGNIYKSANRFSCNIYIAFNRKLPEEYKVVGIDPEYVRYNCGWKYKSFNTIYIEFKLNIKKSSDEEELKKELLKMKEMGLRALLRTAEEWPQVNDPV